MKALRMFWASYRRNRAALLGLFLFVIVLIAAGSAPLLYPEDPWSMVGRPFLWPGDDPRFILGTDPLGRDIAAGILHGARISLAVGFVATAVALLFGVSIGAFAGYHGSWVDDLLMRFTEIFQTVPPFLFAVVIVAIFQPSLNSIVLAISIVSWPPVARLVRGEFIALREREYVQSCVSIGMRDTEIIFRQILPNALPPVIVSASIMVATAVLMESGLSFLGLGDRNVMSWGTLIAIGRDVLRNAWYITAVPGLAILLAVLALNLIGEGLNDALNPRLRDR